MRALIGSLALAVVAGAAPLGAEALHPRSLTYPDLAFAGIQPVKRVTKQGITLILLEDHEQPTLELHGMLRAGTGYEPADKVGLADMVAALMRTGGAGRFSGDELDEALDFVAASVSVATGVDSASVSARGLTRDQDLLLEALHAVVVAPRFAPEKIEEVRGRMLDDLRRQNDQPGEIARRELKKIVYGAESPWARTPTAASLRSITRDDLVRFHKDQFRPGHLILGVTGDFQADELTRRIEGLFADWSGGATPALVPPSTQAARPGVTLARKAVNQSTVRMGHLGLPLMHPDYHACLVLNRILGIGTFTSRMGVEIRSNRGLAYSVGSGLFEGRGPGMFIAVAGTKGESTHEVTRLMREVIQGMSQGVTDKELDDAKNTLLNQWVFEFDSSSKVVATKVEHEFYGFPADTLDVYPKKIAAVTRADVARCAKAHLRPDELSVFVVGDADKFGRPVAELGEVTEVTLTEER